MAGRPLLLGPVERPCDRRHRRQRPGPASRRGLGRRLGLRHTSRGRDTPGLTGRTDGAGGRGGSDGRRTGLGGGTGQQTGEDETGHGREDGAEGGREGNAEQSHAPGSSGATPEGDLSGGDGPDLWTTRRFASTLALPYTCRWRPAPCLHETGRLSQVRPTAQRSVPREGSRARGQAPSRSHEERLVGEGPRRASGRSATRGPRQPRTAPPPAAPDLRAARRGAHTKVSRRPWPSSPCVSSSRAASTSGTRPVAGTPR